MRRELAKKLLIELLRNSKESDRKLAKKLGVSQPTITRVRGKIERDGLGQARVELLHPLDVQVLENDGILFLAQP